MLINNVEELKSNIGKEVEIIVLLKSVTVSHTVGGRSFIGGARSNPMTIITTELDLDGHEITGKRFIRNDESEDKNEVIPKFKVGSFYLVKGDYQIDSFTKRETIIVKEMREY